MTHLFSPYGRKRLRHSEALAWAILGVAAWGIAGNVFATPSHSASGTILILGDSLSAGYGVAEGRSWVALLRRKLVRSHWQCHVVNASISGETSSGGRVRLPALLRHFHPKILMLELGANDGLRGTSLRILRTNLTAMIRRAEGSGATVFLIGIELPPNYGPFYTKRFSGIYQHLARAMHLAFVPFLLAHVATHRKLMQPDGLHPNAQGEPRVLANVWPNLKPLLPRACLRS
ncbi:MAG: arylesterase [Gammaproteobacteria bacterium]